MNIDEILNMIDDMLEEASRFPADAVWWMPRRSRNV